MSLKVLVVEDNPQISKLIFLFLKDKYEVIVASTGIEAIELWHKYRPDIAILDIMLPDISGYDICATVKADLELRDTPVIFLSAKSSDESRVKGYNLGAVNYLVKPAKKEELIAVIESTFNMLNINREKTNKVILENMTLITDSMKVFIDEKEVDFTPNEFKILYAFMLKVDIVFSRDSILKILKKENENINDRTIDSHISHIRKKIKSTNIKISSIYGEGYKLEIIKTVT